MESESLLVHLNKRQYRNLLVTKVLVDLLEKMDPKPPKADFDPKSIVIE